MKKIALYIGYVVVSLVGITSCTGRYWDPDDDLRDLTGSWAMEYVDNVLDQKIFSVDTSLAKEWSVTTTIIKDTLYKEIHNKYSKKYPSYDSVDVTSTFIQIRDSLTVKVEGYRYSEKYWAHLFTLDEGILEYEGKFRIDFYEMGKTTPWGWGEVVYSKSKKVKYWDTPYTSEIKIGWY